MAIEKKTNINEILIRFDEDGQIKGAHKVDLETVHDTETGQVYAANELGAEPVTLDALSGLMDESLAGAVAEVASLQKKLRLKDEQITNLQTQVQKAGERIAALEEQVSKRKDAE